jgi:CubicO group peptidase (beta-lactamase class C family)
VSPAVIEEITGRPYTEALYEDFFRPLGATTLRYNPRSSFPAYRIVPTETDNFFRRELVHGYVHDEASAVLGGISGNAGLFSSAGDLAKLLQMYLNSGEYGGIRYLSKEVIDEFTSVQFPENNNRRGLGFDKPLIDNDLLPVHRRYPSEGASPSSFGHSGFTGTFVWMDPEYDLLYIFLSNRVHPTRDNNLISSLNIRTAILQVFYDELEKTRGYFR